MTQYEDEFDFDDAENTPLVKKLRKQIESLQKQVTERDEELSSIRVGARKSTVESILEEYGLSPRIAKYIPDDIEADEDAIAEWLYENGEDFGIVAVDENDSDESVSAAELMSSVEEGGIDPTVGQDIAARIASAKSPEELMSILNG